VNQGYYQSGGTLAYHSGTLAYDELVGKGTISGGTIVGDALNGLYCELDLDNVGDVASNWAIKGSTKVVFHVDGSNNNGGPVTGTGKSNFIKLGKNQTLTIGDDSTHNNVVIDTIVDNANAPTGNAYALFVGSLNTGTTLTIYNITQMSIIVDPNSPHTATWSYSYANQNFILTAQ
jgi:hypothetical protein